MSAPEITSSTVTLRCVCGADGYEVEDIHEGWQHLIPCDECDRTLSVQFDNPIVQYVTDGPRKAGATS